jgi:hypothetical protein
MEKTIIGLRWSSISIDSHRVGCINAKLTFTGWLIYFWPITYQLANVSWHVIGQK